MGADPLSQNHYQKRQHRTMFFIGVSTASSSIMQVFPLWSEYLGLNASLEGFDFAPDSPALQYREAVQFIQSDENSWGALVTTHKLNLFHSCEDLFHGFGPYASILKELSCISKRHSTKGSQLWGHAKDPITSALSLESIIGSDYWQHTGGDLLLLGAGGASLALTLSMIRHRRQSKDSPDHIAVCDCSESRLAGMRTIHQQMGSDILFSYHYCPNSSENDSVVAQLRPQSVIANATGLGKDLPGSPLTDCVCFPERAVIWDFNYRGDLIFLEQAKAQQKTRELSINDGWLYFIYGWLHVIGEVFDLNIPKSGSKFEELSQLAKNERYQ